MNLIWCIWLMNLESKNPLQNLILFEQDARGYGFDWPDHEMILEQAIDECRER